MDAWTERSGGEDECCALWWLKIGKQALLWRQFDWPEDPGPTTPDPRENIVICVRIGTINFIIIKVLGKAF